MMMDKNKLLKTHIFSQVKSECCVSYCLKGKLHANHFKTKRNPGDSLGSPGLMFVGAALHNKDFLKVAFPTLCSSLSRAVSQCLLTLSDRSIWSWSLGEL